MVKGIFNPFNRPGTPKKNFVGATDPKNPLDTEYRDDVPKSNIRLDGDSYVLQINNVEMEELHTRLELLVREVAREHGAALAAAGVSYVDKSATMELRPGEQRLETPMGFIIVYAGEDGKEVDCFRRLAYALYGLPIKDILDKYHASVYKRG